MTVKGIVRMSLAVCMATSLPALAQAVTRGLGLSRPRPLLARTRDTARQTGLSRAERRLNLSRAWMLEGMAAGLPEGDQRIVGLRAAAGVHREAGLRSVTGEHYEGGHWLGTFAVYLVTGRGLSDR